MARYWYSSESAHGSSSSHGFSNDTIVRVWDSRADRDNYVSESSNITVDECPRSEVTRRATNRSLTRNDTNAPHPFSGEYWAIVRHTDIDYPGYVGTVECAGGPDDDDDYADVVRRFYDRVPKRWR